jgi:hypothetical protein
MAKSKYAPALFEVIGTRQEAKTSGTLQIPKWWKSKSGQQPATDAPEQVASPEAAAAQPAEVADSSQPTGAPVDATVDGVPSAASPSSTETAQPRFWWRRDANNVAEPEAPAPLLRSEGGRVVLSFTPVHATVACGVILLALFTCYQFGRLTRPAAPVAVASVADDLEKTLQQPPNPAVLNVRPSTPTASRQPSRSAARATDAAAKPVAAAAPKPTPEAANVAAVPAAAVGETPRRSASLTYVVLETFSPEDKASAEFAQKWLDAKGVATRVEQRGSRWRLVSAEGFDCSQAAEEQRCMQYCEQAKTLGKACSTELRRAKLSIYNLSKPLKERASK